MMWDEWEDKENNLLQQQQTEEESESGEECEEQGKGHDEEESYLKFDFLSVLSKPPVCQFICTCSCFGGFFFLSSVNRVGVYFRTIIGYWKLIMMPRRMLFDRTIFV